MVIGKNQNAYAEIDLSYAKEHGIHVSRRITGGGAVYHDSGNINYSLIVSEQRAQSLDYAYFTAPILRALSDLGLSCKLNGRNDLECDGRKFSGNAQYTANGRILHHGTILFDTDVSVMSDVLKIDKEKLAYRAVKSCKSRVVNLSELLNQPMDIREFMDHLERYLTEQLRTESISVPTDPRLDDLWKRNQSEEWIYAEKRYLTHYSVLRKKKYPFGLVQVEMDLDRDRIERIRISGDFFGTSPIEELEKNLVGQSIEQIPPLELSPFIKGMSLSDFSNLLRN